MDDVTRSRSSSQVTSMSSNHVPRPPTPPVLASRLGARTAADEGFSAVLQDINRMIRAEGYSEDLPRQGEGEGGEDSKSTHVDGQYTDGNVTDGDNDSQVVDYVTHTHTESHDVTMGADGTVTMQHEQTTEVKQHYVQDDGSEVDGRNDGSEIYSQVIKPQRPARFSDISPEINDQVDWENPPAVPLYTGGANIYTGTSQPLQGENNLHVQVENTQTIHANMNHITIHGEAALPLEGVMARVDRTITHPEEPTRGNNEWQESVLQVGDDWEQGGEGYGAQAVGVWAQHQSTSTAAYNMYQTPKDNTTATIVTVHGQANPTGSLDRHANLNASLDRRSVSFTSDTRENEGLSKRYSKEGFRAPSEMWSGTTNRPAPIGGAPNFVHTNTWPHPANTGDVSVVMSKEEYTFPGSSLQPSYGRVFPGTQTITPPSAIHPDHAQTYPRPGAIERGIQITSTDTWQRHADNTSVINIDTPTDGRSTAGMSMGPSIAGYSGVYGTPHGSLNRAGSPVYPTMLTTSAAFQHNRYGLSPMGNGFNHMHHTSETATIDFDDEKPLTEKPTHDKYKMPSKDKSIAIEKRTRKCRIITFAVIIIVFIAVIIGVILGLNKP